MADVTTPPGKPPVPFLLGLALATLVAFAPAFGNDFVGLDDPLYVTENPAVNAGLSWPSARWALTATDAFNWHPLTWLSLQLDYSLFRLRPWGYHCTNVLLHTASALLLFWLLRRLTGADWRSFFVAALFALHPLHVESVAWVAERKDVLSGLFAMLTLWAYAAYAQRPGALRYLAVVLALGLGLMAKPVLVTLPLVLLLLDYWPLRRLLPGPAAGTSPVCPPASLRLILGEKVPLLALAAASCVVTVVAQHRGGAVQPLEAIPLSARLANTVVSYAAYLGQTVWPLRLAAFYPYPAGGYPAGQVVAAAVLLACVTAAALLLARRGCRYPLVGWLWYLGMLVPMIGLVQVGEQARADRYTYLPLVGIFLALVWGLADLAVRRPALRHVLAVAGGGALAGCFVGTWVQAGAWHDDRTLWEHAVRVTSGNYLAHDSLGVALLKDGWTAEAVDHLREAVRLRPDYTRAYSNLAGALAEEGRPGEAIEVYRKALKLDPRSALLRYNLAMALAQQGEVRSAIAELSEAVRLDPSFAAAHHALARALAHERRLAEAVGCCREAVRLEPDNPEYRSTLARLLRQAGDGTGGPGGNGPRPGPGRARPLKGAAPGRTAAGPYSIPDGCRARRIRQEAPCTA
jgi:Flp pilus assembly protein TadD